MEQQQAQQQRRPFIPVGPHPLVAATSWPLPPPLPPPRAIPPGQPLSRTQAMIQAASAAAAAVSGHHPHFPHGVIRRRHGTDGVSSPMSQGVLTAV